MSHTEKVWLLNVTALYQSFKLNWFQTNIQKHIQYRDMILASIIL